MESISDHFNSATATTKKKRILIVDDHPLVRQGLAQFINQERDMLVCAEASDGHEALQIIEEASPDLAIVDIQMKGMGGMDLVRALNLDYPEVRVLMLSMHDEELYAMRALNAGAQGYLMKEEDPEKVVQAIRTVMQGEVSVSQAVQRKILITIASGSGANSTSLDHLSDRELEVFKMIGKGYPSRLIASDLHLSTKTVESYKARLKHKLKLKDATELRRYAAAWMKSEGHD